MDRETYGYVGKIVRIDLTSSMVEEIPTSNYTPDFIGGREICNKIFWDDIKPGVSAFDPENELIFMTSPTTGTGIPTGSRGFMVSIGASMLPEQYSHGSIGGWISPMLKFAGYDGFIIQGRAPEHTYVLIEDGKVEFRSAEPIWGTRIHQAQAWLKEQHGNEAHAMVIGPAGENLCRDATITTDNDNALAKSGFGAVMGSKNLKGVVIKGTGAVVPANVEKVFNLREKMCGGEIRMPNPIIHMTTANTGITSQIDVPDGYDMIHTTCSLGCTFRCNNTYLDMPSAVDDRKVSQIEKCCTQCASNLEYDSCYYPFLYVKSEVNDYHSCRGNSGAASMDYNDPDADIIFGGTYKGNKTGFPRGTFEAGNVMCQLRNEYGLDKYDMLFWTKTWFHTCKAEGLLDDLDFGMEPDFNDPAFIKHYIESVVYRKGIGDVFAEGMARAIRTLGKGKYGDTIYHGMTNSETGAQLDIPVSFEGSWGHGTHWQGRGIGGGCPKWMWLMHSLVLMVNTHNSIGSGHAHVKPSQVRAFADEGHGRHELAAAALDTTLESEIKDTVSSCEWASPDPWWPEMEPEMLEAATGIKMTPEELKMQAMKGQLLQRAILMRNFGRTRDMEAEEVFPIMTYPDPWGETCEWDEWNDLVDEFYELHGWDIRTGWPLRNTWDEAGMSDIADELAELGLIPDPAVPYERKANPFKQLA